MSKPERCPDCGSDQMVEILYGLPTADAGEAASRGEIILGGCMTGPGSPEWGCGACGWEPRPSDPYLLEPEPDGA